MNIKMKLAPLAVTIVLGATGVGSATAHNEIIVDQYLDISTLQEELVVAQRQADMVWVPGYWKYEGDKWHWIEGQWIVNETDWIVDDIVEC